MTRLILVTAFLIGAASFADCGWNCAGGKWTLSIACAPEEPYCQPNRPETISNPAGKSCANAKWPVIAGHCVSDESWTWKPATSKRLEALRK